MKRDTAEWLACMLLASLGLVYALWVVPYIPMQDGPHHLLAAHIENHYSDPGSVYPDYYRVLPQLTAKGFSLIFGPLEGLLPWRLALRLTLSLVALAFAWGFALVVLALDRERRPFALLGFVIALPWTLYMGLFSFYVGSAFGLYTLALVLRRPPETNARRALLALLLLLQGVCHVFSALLIGVVAAVVMLANAPKGERLRELGRLVLIGAPTAGLLLLAFLGIGVGDNAPQAMTLGRLSEVSRWFVPGPELRAWLVVGLMLVGIAATLARARGRTRTVSELSLAWVGLGFVALSLVAPLHVRGWQFFAPRFAAMALVLGLALLRVPERAGPLAKRALAPFLALCALGSSCVSAGLHRQLARGCADALAAVDASPHYPGAWLKIVIDPFCGVPRDAARSPIPHAALAANLPLLSHIDHGGIEPTLFNGSPFVHAIELRAEAPVPAAPDGLMESLARSPWFSAHQEFRRGVLTGLAADGMPFTGIHLVGGRPDDAAVFVERGYVTEFARGSILVARFEGCAAELLLPPSALNQGVNVYYEYGLLTAKGVTPEPRALAKRLIPRATPAGSDALHVPLTERPCGQLWLRVVWDSDGSFTYSPGDRICANSNREGRLLATVTAQQSTVRCAPPLP
ncbi:MAG TPA: hypothetical protein VHP33_03570 [Polyangiaceae bacterium]|nr:hypothetical protein [Polyangiaceae bacterium]